VQNNVRLPLDLAGDDRTHADAKVAAALELVGLKGFENHYPRQLSGGMQMRASIARSLVTEPNLLLMDEPFGALDEITRNKLDADIIQLWWRKKLTVIFVTHSIYEAVFLSTRVIVMAARPGRVLKEVLIDEPHPRTDAFRVTQKFAAYAKELSELLAQASASEGLCNAPHAIGQHAMGLQGLVERKRHEGVAGSRMQDVAEIAPRRLLDAGAFAQLAATRGQIFDFDPIGLLEGGRDAAMGDGRNIGRIDHHAPLAFRRLHQRSAGRSMGAACAEAREAGACEHGEFTSCQHGFPRP
jgi:ABC-type proline/glycine betaine transport system ATPase subunit